jgi:hypothetical protein
MVCTMAPRPWAPAYCLQWRLLSAAPGIINPPAEWKAPSRLGFSKLGQSPPAAHGTPADAKFQRYPEPGKPASDTETGPAGPATAARLRPLALSASLSGRTASGPSRDRAGPGPDQLRRRPRRRAGRPGPPSDTERPPADKTTAGPSPTPNLKFKLAGPPGAGLAQGGPGAARVPSARRPGLSPGSLTVSDRAQQISAARLGFRTFKNDGAAPQ